MSSDYVVFVIGDDTTVGEIMEHLRPLPIASKCTVCTSIYGDSAKVIIRRPKSSSLGVWYRLKSSLLFSVTIGFLLLYAIYGLFVYFSK